MPKKYKNLAVFFPFPAARRASPKILVRYIWRMFFLRPSLLFLNKNIGDASSAAAAVALFHFGYICLFFFLFPFSPVLPYGVFVTAHVKDYDTPGSPSITRDTRV